MPRSNISQLNLAPKDAYRIYEKAADLADTLEDVLENNAVYSKEFIKGLKLSLRQAKQGKLKRIDSLKQLK